MGPEDEAALSRVAAAMKRSKSDAVRVLIGEADERLRAARGETAGNGDETKREA